MADDELRASKEGNGQAQNAGGDPRGGLQSDDYRHADPRELVEEDGTVMAGPGGAAQEDDTPDERRERDRSG